MAVRNSDFGNRLLSNLFGGRRRRAGSDSGELLTFADSPDAPASTSQPSQPQGTAIDEALSSVPEAPGPDTPTGITGPGSDMVPNAQGHISGETLPALGQDVVDQAEADARGEFAAREEDKARADEFAGDVTEQRDETTAEFDTAIEEVRDFQEQFNADLDDAGEQLQAIPGEVDSRFGELRDEFTALSDASFDRVEGQREEALGNVMQGRSMAMEAAVQGIQGNVNNQIAKIQSNPNLTDAQKQGMISQVRLAGASSMAPAIGQTVLAFNQLSADVATKFGTITGALEGASIAAQGQLIGVQGQVYAQTRIAVGEMTNQLLEIDANANVAFANSQSQLLGARAHAQMTSNDILLRTLPEQGTPWMSLTDSAIAAYTIANDLSQQWHENNLNTTGMEIYGAVLREQVGTPQQNMWQAFWGGLAQGGLPQGIFQAVGAGFGGQR